jgi:hypothetical protein
METEEIYQRMFQEFKRHPLTSNDIQNVVYFLHNVLKIRTGNIEIMDGYNRSERVKDAYSNLLRESKKNSVYLGGGRSGKVRKARPSDSGVEGDDDTA